MRSYGYQLFSSRNFPPLKDTLAQLSALGYTRVEGYGDLFENDHDVGELKSLLALHSLEMPSAHIALDSLEAPESAIEIAKQLGISTVFAPYLAPEERPHTAAGWSDFAKKLVSLGAPVWDAGLAFGWHNHDFEFQDIDGVYPIDLIAEADPRLALELDLAWIVRAGEDPHHWMTKFASQVKAVHIKDIAPASENANEDGWADIGHGTVDWKGLIAAAEQTAAAYFYVEHDNPSDDMRFARRSIESLKGY